MDRIQFDIRHFLRSPDGKKMLTHPPMRVINDEVIQETIPSSDTSSPVNMSAVLLVITLIVIAIMVFIYVYNRKKNSTKEIINQKVKEDGTN